MKKWLFLTILLIYFPFALEVNSSIDITTAGSVQSYTVQENGIYKLEVWGSQGQNGEHAGGQGGYSAGYIELREGDVLYIACGTYGDRNYSGGWNGGGKGGSSETWYPGYSGGGATHIALNSNRGVLSNYKDHQNEVLIVAGGGGGGSQHGYSGAGGGTNGGVGLNKNQDRSSYGGSQTSGAAFGQGSDGTSCKGAAAYGSNGKGGGGGGWYGGGSDWYCGEYSCAGGGGGSGYIGGVGSWQGISPVTQNGGNTGYGKAKITLVEITMRNDAVASAIANLVYNGSTITGVNYANVNISGHQAINAGTHTATATPIDGHAWSDGSTGAKNINWTIAKANSSITAVPTSKQLIYNETDQALVTAGTANGGTIKYKIGNDGAWNEALPLGNAPGDYVIFYKVFGDKNHNDTSESNLTSTILQNWKRYTINCLTDSSGNPIRPNVSIISGTYTIKSAIFDVKAQDSNPYKFCIGKGVTVSEINYNGTQPNVHYPENS